MQTKITFSQQDVIGSISLYFEYLYQQVGSVKEF